MHICVSGGEFSQNHYWIQVSINNNQLLLLLLIVLTRAPVHTGRIGVQNWPKPQDSQMAGQHRHFSHTSSDINFTASVKI